MMTLLLELSDPDRGCVARKRTAGAEPAEAERACQDTYSFQQGAFARSFAYEGPQEPPGEAEDDPEDETTPGEGKPRQRVTESPYGQFPGRSPAGHMTPSPYGARSLAPGFAPYPKNPRTEAHIWAKELSSAGQRPPFQRDAWAVHAQRMGLSPDQVVDGWDYIENVFSKRVEEKPLGKLVRMLREFSATAQGSRWSGTYFGHPHELRVRMQGDRGPTSWPWVTKSAEAVFQAAEKFIAKHPDTNIETAFEQGLEGAKVSVFDLTPEDDALMGIALQWKLQGKEADPQPPIVPNQRGVTGFKGTQIGHGRELAPRGAP